MITLAFLSFHVRVGVRVALRILAPVIAVIFAFYFILRPDFFIYLAGVVFVESSPWILGLILATAALAGARSASLRVCYGLSGWMRHLPSTAEHNRRMAALAVFIGQTPVLAVLAFFTLIAGQGRRLDLLPTLVGIVLLGLSASWTEVPVRRAWTSAALGFPACVLFGSGRWPLLGLGLVLLLCLDRVSGPLRPSKKRPGMRSAWRPLGLLTVISSRAVGWKIIIPYGPALVVLGFVRLFIINNDPSLRLSTAAASFGGLMSVALFLALAASLLAGKRPPWPLLRTLPLSSKRRILADSLFLGLHAILITFPLSWIDRGAFVLVTACLPLAAVRAAAAIRQDRELRFGAWGKMAAEGVFGALLISLWPWAAAGLVFALIPAFRAAVRVERKNKVSQWLELHHLAAGDSLSWSEG